MKEFFRTTGVVLLALIIAGFLANSAAADMERPFKFKSVGQSTAVNEVCSLFEESGQATHLGKFSASTTACICGADADYVYWCGEGVTTAANGDKLFLYVLGKTTYAGVPAKGTIETTGGTGRFGGAEGLTEYLQVYTAPGIYTNSGSGWASY